MELSKWVNDNTPKDIPRDGRLYAWLFAIVSDAWDYKQTEIDKLKKELAKYTDHILKPKECFDCDLVYYPGCENANCKKYDSFNRPYSDSSCGD